MEKWYTYIFFKDETSKKNGTIIFIWRIFLTNQLFTNKDILKNNFHENEYFYE